MVSDPAMLGTTETCPVNSHNEWDPLEEVIVGRLEGAVIPSPHITVTRNVPPAAAKLYRLVGGRRYPKVLVNAATRELDQFVHILKAEGVIVRRPDAIDLTVRTRTPYWK